MSLSATPLVSVIVPAYNVAPYLAECLESALAQTYTPLEIIVVDNNSTDDTPRIARDYANRYPDRVRLLHQPVQGAPAARNMGIEHARGEWWQFLDADDLLLPKKIERQLALEPTETVPVMVVAGCRYQKYSGSGVYRVDAQAPPLLSALRGTLGNTVSNLYRRTAIRWDETLTAGQDLDFIFAYAFAQSITYSPHVDCLIRDRPAGQISRQAPPLVLGAVFELRTAMAAALRTHEPALAAAHAHSIYAQRWKMLFRLAQSHPGVALRRYAELGPPPVAWQPAAADQIRPMWVRLFRLWSPRRFFQFVYFTHKIRTRVRARGDRLVM